MATRAGVEEYSTSPSAQRSSERSIRASWTTGYWGADASIRASICDPIRDHRADDPAGQLARPRVGLDLGEIPLQDGDRRALAEVRLEHRGKATRRPARSDRTRSPDACSRGSSRLASARPSRCRTVAAACGEPAACDGSPSDRPDRTHADPTDAAATLAPERCPGEVAPRRAASHCADAVASGR